MISSREVLRRAFKQAGHEGAGKDDSNFEMMLKVAQEFHKIRGRNEDRVIRLRVLKDTGLDTPENIAEVMESDDEDETEEEEPKPTDKKQEVTEDGPTDKEREEPKTKVFRCEPCGTESFEIKGERLVLCRMCKAPKGVIREITKYEIKTNIISPEDPGVEMLRRCIGGYKEKNAELTKDNEKLNETIKFYENKARILTDTNNELCDKVKQFEGLAEGRPLDCFVWGNSTFEEYHRIFRCITHYARELYCDKFIASIDKETGIDHLKEFKAREESESSFLAEIRNVERSIDLFSASRDKDNRQKAHARIARSVNIMLATLSGLNFRALVDKSYTPSF